MIAGYEPRTSLLATGLRGGNELRMAFWTGGARGGYELRMTRLTQRKVSAG
jgi:hypothetical protein